MSSSVLYDAPGPRARLRHRLYTVVGGLLVLAFLAWIFISLWNAEQITPDKWEFLTEWPIVQGLLEGLRTTLLAAAAAITLAVAFGAIFAFGKLSDHAVVRLPSIAVIEFFRAVPVLLLIFFIYLTYADSIGSFWALVFGLTLYNGAVLAEVFRAGILAVPSGQAEAGYAIGLRKGQIQRIILGPQAISTMLPAIISQCVIALKDTALGYVIGTPEFTKAGKQIFTSFIYNNPIAVGLVLMATYIVINYSLSLLARWLESRMRRRGREVVRQDPADAAA